MNEQAIRFRLGVFVFAALLILALLITLFGGLPNVFKQTAAYQIIFSSANGLAIGSPVRKSGVKIGEVRSVQLDDLSGKVNVGIEIDKDITLRQSDRPTLQTALLGGDAYIAFMPPENEKKLDPTPVPRGAVLQGDLPPDPARILQKTSELLPPAEEALVEIKRVFEKLDQGRSIRSPRRSGRRRR
jgi:phospholipid/cholesterol/gamma-HCH transport system substrate-binding protein